MYIPREQRGAVFTSIHGHTWIFFLFSLHTSRAECRCAITTRKSWQIFFLSKVNFHGRFFFWARSVSTYDHVYFMYTRMYTHSMYVCMYVCVCIRMYTHRMYVCMYVCMNLWKSWQTFGRISFQAHSLFTATVGRTFENFVPPGGQTWALS